MLGILPLGAIEQAGGARQIARRRFLPSGADAAAQQEEGGKVLLGDAERHTGDREAFAAGAVENLRAPWHGDAAPLLEQRLEQRHLARSEEHTSELQSLMRISYAAFSL